MKKIPHQYEGRGKGDQKGFSFSLIHKTDEMGKNHCALWGKSKRTDPETTYEVTIIRKRSKDRCIGERVICRAGDEYLPSSAEWGRYGWTYATLEQAMNKIEELKGRNEERTTA